MIPPQRARTRTCSPESYGECRPDHVESKNPRRPVTDIAGTGHGVNAGGKGPERRRVDVLGHIKPGHLHV